MSESLPALLVLGLIFGAATGLALAFLIALIEIETAWLRRQHFEGEERE